MNGVLSNDSLRDPLIISTCSAKCLSLVVKVFSMCGTPPYSPVLLRPASFSCLLYSVVVFKVHPLGGKTIFIRVQIGRIRFLGGIVDAMKLCGKLQHPFWMLHLRVFQL